MTLTNGDLKSIKTLMEVTFDEKFEARGVATKSDLKQFATKSDIKLLATKKDIHKIDKKFDELFNFLDKDFSKTKREVKEIREHINFPSVVI